MKKDTFEELVSYTIVEIGTAQFWSLKGIVQPLDSRLWELTQVLMSPASLRGIVSRCTQIGDNASLAHYFSILSLKGTWHRLGTFIFEQRLLQF